MKLTRLLFKPRWENKDAAIRRDAVANDRDPELVAALPEFARRDPDAGVRLAALKRIAEPALAQALAHDDTDASVRTAARELFRDLLTGTHAAAPALEVRVRLLRAQDDPALLEHLARHAPERELRAAALARVERPALIAERASTDPDAAIRLAALERIDDVAQLDRIAERARKSDKTVARRAKERAEALRVGRGDAATIAARARLLCERLEALVRAGGDRSESTAIATRWTELGAGVPAELATRYAAVVAFLDAPARAAALAAAATVARDAQIDSEPLVSDDSVTQSAESGDVELAAAGPVSVDADFPVETPVTAPIVDEDLAGERSDATDALAAQVRFAASISAAGAADRRDREQKRAFVDEIEQAVSELEAALDAGEATSANAALARIATPRRRVGDELPRALAARLAAVEKRRAELSDWQRWADNQRRRAICDDIEALIGAGVHPDAVATRVREAQTEWTRLDAAEARSAEDIAKDGMTRRFRALCRKAIEPAKPYFDKRDELRKSHAAELATLIQRVEALPASEDWRALVAPRREVAAALRDLDRVGPRERNVYAKQLKALLQRLDTSIDAEYATVEQAKQALIAKAQRLAESADPSSATREARDLQRTWQAAGNGRRRTDEAQWKTFRAALDAVFARLDSVRVERETRDADARREAEAVVDEYEAAAARDDATSAELSAILKRWEALDSREPALRDRVRAVQQRQRDASERRERARRHARFDAWHARYLECRAIERGERAAESASTDVGDRNARRGEAIAADALDRRIADGANGAEADETVLRERMVALEHLAGIDSPAADKQRRLDYQVSRLSARMRGDRGDEPVENFARELDAWTRVGRPSPSIAADIDARFERAFDAIRSTLP